MSHKMYVILASLICIHVTTHGLIEFKGDCEDGIKVILDHPVTSKTICSKSKSLTSAPAIKVVVKSSEVTTKATPIKVEKPAIVLTIPAQDSTQHIETLSPQDPPTSMMLKAGAIGIIAGALADAIFESKVYCTCIGTAIGLATGCIIDSRQQNKTTKMDEQSQLIKKKIHKIN